MSDKQIQLQAQFDDLHASGLQSEELYAQELALITDNPETGLAILGQEGSIPFARRARLFDDALGNFGGNYDNTNRLITDQLLPSQVDALIGQRIGLPASSNLILDIDTILRNLQTTGGKEDIGARVEEWAHQLMDRSDWEEILDSPVSDGYTVQDILLIAIWYSEERISHEDRVLTNVQVEYQNAEYDDYGFHVIDDYENEPPRVEGQEEESYSIAPEVLEEAIEGIEYSEFINFQIENVEAAKSRLYVLLTEDGFAFSRTLFEQAQRNMNEKKKEQKKEEAIFEAEKAAENVDWDF